MSYDPEIVLIDDDADWAETLADYLQAKGFRVQIANGGSAGLDFLAKHSIPLALVDWNMPDLDGLELLRKLRHLKRDVSVFLLSGDDEPSLPSRAVAEGAKGFLPKTTPPNMLVQTVRQALNAVLGRPEPGKRYLPAVRRNGRMLPVARREEDPAESAEPNQPDG